MEYIILIVAGFLGGTLTSFFGLGGGLVIVPALVIYLPLYHVDPSVVMHLSVGTSLAIMMVNSLAAIWPHHQAKNIDWSLFRQVLPFAVIGTFVGCIVAMQLPTHILILLFLIFMMVVIINLITYLRKQAVNIVVEDKVVHPSPPMIKKVLGGLLSGLIGACMGVGSSLIMVPLLKRYGFYIRECAGLSSGFNVFIALTATLSYGFFKPVDENFTAYSTGYIFWPTFIWLLIGSIVGVPFGTWLGQHLSEKLSTYIYFGLLMIILFVMLYKLFLHL